MAEAAFLTVCSADSYQWFIPLYVYSTKCAYPEYHVRVHVRGELDPRVTNILETVKEKVDAHWMVVGSLYADVQWRASTCNCLRYLAAQEVGNEFKHVLFTDVDMIHFRHEPTHVQYYANMMTRTQQPFAGVRGALRRPYRKKITRGQGWTGDYHRIVGGLFAVKTKPWLKATRDEYRRYTAIARSGKADGRDGIPWASYPEYDEVMLSRIIHFSGLTLPTRRFRFSDNVRFDMRYRDVHLGDFEGAKWKDKKKLAQRLTKWAVKQYRKLEEDPVWQEVVYRCCADDRVRRLVHNLRVEAGIR